MLHVTLVYPVHPLPPHFIPLCLLFFSVSRRPITPILDLLHTTTSYSPRSSCFSIFITIIEHQAKLHPNSPPLLILLLLLHKPSKMKLALRLLLLLPPAVTGLKMEGFNSGINARRHREDGIEGQGRVK